MQKQGGRAGWKFLVPRLRLLIEMQRLWGKVTELYKGSTQSLYVKEAMPPWIRSADSQATRWWDLASVIFIIWVATVVPCE